MTDLPPDTGTAADVGPDGGSTAGTPLWVKAFGIVALVVVLLVGILLLAGGGPGGHGPDRHTGGAGGNTPATGVIEDHTPSGGDLGGLTPPEGGHR